MVGTCDYQKELYTSNYNVQNRLTAKGARLELPVLTQSPVRWPIRPSRSCLGSVQEPDANWK